MSAAVPLPIVRIMCIQNISIIQFTEEANEIAEHVLSCTIFLKTSPKQEQLTLRLLSHYTLHTQPRVL